MPKTPPRPWWLAKIDRKHPYYPIRKPTGEWFDAYAEELLARARERNPWRPKPKLTPAEVAELNVMRETLTPKYPVTKIGPKIRNGKPVMKYVPPSNKLEPVLDEYGAPVFRNGKYLLRLNTKGQWVPVTESTQVWKRSREYTWRSNPFKGVGTNDKGEEIVFRTVSRAASAPNSWIYPPKTWAKGIYQTHRRGKGQKRERVKIGTTFHTTRARDMKPGLLGTQEYVVVPVLLNPKFLSHLHRRGG